MEARERGEMTEKLLRQSEPESDAGSPSSSRKYRAGGKGGGESQGRGQGVSLANSRGRRRGSQGLRAFSTLSFLTSSLF